MKNTKEEVRLSAGHLQGEYDVSYQLRQVGQVLSCDQAAGNRSGQRAVSATYLQTKAGNLYPPICPCVCLCSRQPSGSFTHWLDGEVGDVH